MSSAIRDNSSNGAQCRGLGGAEKYRDGHLIFACRSNIAVLLFAGNVRTCPAFLDQFLTDTAKGVGALIRLKTAILLGALLLLGSEQLEAAAIPGLPATATPLAHPGSLRPSRDVAIDS